MIALSLIVVLLGVVCSVVSQLVPFPASNGGEFSIMTLTDNDEVIVAGRNVIYRLSANLSVLDSVTTSGAVRGLSLTNGGQYVMVCVNTGRSCSGYNVTDFTDTSSGIMLSGSAASEDDPVAMFPGEAEGDVYVGTAALGSSVYPMVLGQYNITGGSIVTDKRTRDYDVSASLLSEREFHIGFVIGDYAYYIVEDREIDIRIVRICINESLQMFRALYEVDLECGGSVAFVGASVARDYPYPGNDTLFLAVRSSVVDGLSRVCTYGISNINVIMDNSLTECANGNLRRVVWGGSILSDAQLNTFCGRVTVSLCSSHL